ncbi:MAG: alpha-amylase family glycosyl hydrolase [Clostridium sp.]|nr:alpha-amylase family glycosyl hydrolase [Clostridium sp.]MCI7442027.1 alpha-amylase family glycosyl hydrolase [Clostridium sp.]
MTKENSLTGGVINNSSTVVKNDVNGVLPSDYDSLTPTLQYQARDFIYRKNVDIGWEDFTVTTGQFAGDCMELNTENPTVYNYLVDAYSKYIDMGVDAFRIDTVKHMNDSTWNVTYVDSHDYGSSINGNDENRYAGGTDAWAENLDLMFTFRGIPCLYYGSEVEFQAGQKADKGNTAPLSTTGRAYFGDFIEGSVDVTDFSEYSNATETMAQTLNSPLSKHIQRLNQIRKAILALRRGQYSTEGVLGDAMAFKRRYTTDGIDSFVCVAISGSATFTGIPSGTYVDAITGKTVQCNGTLTTDSVGKGNMRVYVLQNSSGISGKIGEDGTYLK